ncbi:MAG: NfeD family protein [Planctomycetota bacterium]
MEMMLLAGIGMLGVSLLLIVIEAFVPSGGIIGIVAAVCAIVGIVILWRVSTIWGVSGLLVSAVLGPMCFAYALKVMPDTAFGRQMLGPGADEIAEIGREERQAERERRLALLDLEGIALTDMRPVGMIEIDGEQHEASAEGGLIDRGSAVRVTDVSGLEIRVRAV